MLQGFILNNDLKYLVYHSLEIRWSTLQGMAKGITEKD